MDFQDKKLLDSLKSSLVPICEHGNERPLTKSDYLSYTSCIDEQLYAVSDLVLASRASLELYLDDIDVVSHLTIICGQHSARGPWVTDGSLAFCSTLISQVCSAYEQKNGHTLFQNTKILMKTLDLLRSELLPTTFKYYPASVVCYSWILKKIRTPYLGEYLPDLLPSALIISDDFETYNIKMGLECLQHIVENVALERLKWYGQDDVILDSLKKCLYLTEPDIVSCLLPCFITLMEKSFHHSTSLRYTQFDGVMKNIFFNMYVEQKLKLRHIYVKNMSNLIEARGLAIVRHLTFIFKILTEYTVESTTTTESLKALTKIVKVCWSRGELVGEHTLIILLKLLVEMSQNPSKYNAQEVLTYTRPLATLIKQAFPEIVNTFLENIDNNGSIDDKLLSYVEQVLR